MRVIVNANATSQEVDHNARLDMSLSAGTGSPILRFRQYNEFTGGSENGHGLGIRINNDIEIIS